MKKKKAISQEVNSIIDILAKFPQGALIDEIEKALNNNNLTRRTLQRRLQKLKSTEKITTEGHSHNVRYVLIKKNISIKNESSPENDLFPITLSAKAKKILALVSRPIAERKIVGYNRDFLYNYIPNETNYLNPEEKDKLKKISLIINHDNPTGTYTKEVFNRLLIDFSWNSSRLEGNTYSLLDTLRLINFGEIAKNRSPQETQMILNHKDAIEFLIESNADIRFNHYTILNLHGLLARNLLPNPASVGSLRNIPFGIHHCAYEPIFIPQIIAEMFDLILTKANLIKDPFEQAFFIMVHIPYLQPFEDVNKRVSRLAANIPFIKNNLSPLSFIDVTEKMYIYANLGVYELNQIELLKEVFIWAYEHSSSHYASIQKTLGEPNLFVMKYQEIISKTIHDIIVNSLNMADIFSIINLAAEKIPNENKKQFNELIDRELISLHEGNIARYKVNLAQFSNWKKNIWEKSAK